MSIWTHVNGSIRIDSFKPLELEDYFKSVDFYGGEETWNKCNMPCGSEGSIQYNIWENPQENALAKYTINIFGDLRDYDDINEIENWFTTILSNFLIRDAILTIDIENGEYYILKVNDGLYHKIPFINGRILKEKVKGPRNT